MDRREFIKKSGILGAGLLTGCVPKKYVLKAFEDGLYDYNDNLVTDYESLLDNVAHFKVDLDYGEGNIKNLETGVGIKYKDKIITAAHYFNYRDGQSYEDILSVKNEHQWIKSKINHIDEKSDIALLEGVPSDYLPLGNSSELRPGHFVATVGEPIVENMGIRTGRVFATKCHENMFRCAQVGEYNIFITWAQSTHGDSGGPVYAFRDGKPEVVGMVVFGYNMLGENIKIDHIKRVLKSYL